MSVSHRHSQRLVAKPHLDLAYVDAAPHQPGRACMTQCMWNKIVVVNETRLSLRFVQTARNLYCSIVEKGPASRPRATVTASTARLVSGTTCFFLTS